MAENAKVNYGYHLFHQNSYLLWIPLFSGQGWFQYLSQIYSSDEAL